MVDSRLEAYANPYGISEEKLRFFLSEWDAMSDSEQAFHEMKLEKELVILLIAINNSKATPGREERLAALKRIYWDKQAEWHLIYGTPDY